MYLQKEHLHSTQTFAMSGNDATPSGLEERRTATMSAPGLASEDDAADLGTSLLDLPSIPPRPSLTTENSQAGLQAGAPP